jgi:hypothetical protein
LPVVNLQYCSHQTIAVPFFLPARQKYVVPAFKGEGIVYSVPETSHEIAFSKLELVAHSSLSALPFHLKFGVLVMPDELSVGSLSEGAVTEIALESVGESHPLKAIIKINADKAEIRINFLILSIPHLIIEYYKKWKIIY